MTENEAEVLGNLKSFGRDDTEGHGARPMDLGGTNGSHHSLTAIRMCKKGWVERTFGYGWGQPKRHPRERGSCRYRITPAGVKALAAHHLTAKLAENL